MSSVKQKRHLSKLMRKRVRGEAVGGEGCLALCYVYDSFIRCILLGLWYLGG